MDLVVDADKSSVEKIIDELVSRVMGVGKSLGIPLEGFETIITIIIIVLMAYLLFSVLIWLWDILCALCKLLYNIAVSPLRFLSWMGKTLATIAYYHKGNEYHEGKEGVQNKAEAVKWWRRAADNSYADAQYSLGDAYDKGEGVSQDKAEAIKWYRRAAEGGVADAQYKMGIAYNTGMGAPQNKAEAVKWWLRAAEQGVTRAQYNLASIYYEGAIGVPQSNQEAYIWFDIATTSELSLDEEEFVRSLFPEYLVGSKAGDRIDVLDVKEKLAKKLSSSDLEEAQAEAVRRHNNICEQE